MPYWTRPETTANRQRNSCTLVLYHTSSYADRLNIFILYIYILEDDEVLVVEDGGGPPAPGGRGGSVRVLPAEVTLSAVTEFLRLASLLYFLQHEINIVMVNFCHLQGKLTQELNYQ